MNIADCRTAFGTKWTSLLALLIAASLPIAARAQAREKERDYEQRIEERENDHNLPQAVLETAERYAPDIKVADVRTREIEGHPKVYVIDGESNDRDVVLHITAEGTILEARFHDRPEGERPTRLNHSAEELPAAVRETAVRIFPGLEFIDVKSHQAPHEERAYHITGRAVEDGKEREVVLIIEADGDLLEARVFKPRIVSAADNADNARPSERDAFDD